MKNRAFIIVFSFSLALAACREAEELNPVRKESVLDNGREVILNLVNNEWTSDTEEGVFAEASGLESGTMPVGVFYRNWKDRRIYGADYSRNPLVPLMEEPLKYRLSIPDDCAEFCHEWYAVSPCYPNTVYAAGKADVNLCVLPVQYPADNTADPTLGYIVSKPFQAGADKAEAVTFKRMTGTLALTVTGARPSEKIYVATLGIGQAISGANSAAGNAEGILADTYTATAVSNVSNPSNTISALYQEGLEAEGGSWTVRYAVNPMEIVAGCTLTLSVTTADSTFVSTSTLDAGTAIEAGKTCALSLDVRPAEGCVRIETFCQGFNSAAVASSLAASSSPDLTASNGKTVNWSFDASGCVLNDGDEDKYDGQPYAVRLNASNGFTIPNMDRTNVSGITLFCHAANNLASDKSIDVYDNGAVVATVPCDASGKAEIDLKTVPGTGLGGKVIRAHDGVLYFTAALVYTDTKPIDMNDYLDMYNAGLDIVIGDQIINKNTCGAKYFEKKAANLESTDISKSLKDLGILFLDNSDADSLNYISTASANLTFGTNKIIIGRYRNMPQPSISLQLATKATKYLYGSGNLRFLNVTIGALNTQYGAFANAGAGTSDDFTINIQDGGLFCDSFGLFRFGNASHNGFKEIVLDNSVIRTGGNIVNASSAGQPVTKDLNKIRINNCVVMSYSGQSDNFDVVELNASTSNLKNADITFTNNTVYELNPSNGLFNVRDVKSLKIENNLIRSTISANRNLVKAGAECGTLTLNNNYALKVGDFIWVPGSTDKFTTYNPATSGNLESTEELFDNGWDASGFYFPSKVNGAGCSYDTKTWIVK